MFIVSKLTLIEEDHGISAYHWRTMAQESKISLLVGGLNERATACTHQDGPAGQDAGGRHGIEILRNLSRYACSSGRDARHVSLPSA